MSDRPTIESRVAATVVRFAFVFGALFGALATEALRAVLS